MTVNAILGHLQNYEIDHHSKAIVDLYPYFIKKQLPSLIPYLNSRLLQTTTLAQKDMGKIKRSSGKDVTDKVTDLPIWFKECDLQQRLVVCAGDEVDGQ